MTIGIYCIECLASGKKYVGQSINIEQRLRTHIAYLKRGQHENPHLQNAWNKYGEEAFGCYVIEECAEKRLDTREEFFVEKLNTLEPRGYNIMPGGNYGQRGRKRAGASSEYMGVSKSKSRKWVMSITVFGRPIVRTYDKEEWAAEDRDLAALQLYGRSCALNFPDQRKAYINMIEAQEPYSFDDVILVTNYGFRLREMFKELHKDDPDYFKEGGLRF